MSSSDQFTPDDQHWSPASSSPPPRLPRPDAQVQQVPPPAPQPQQWQTQPPLPAQQQPQSAEVQQLPQQVQQPPAGQQPVSQTQEKRSAKTAATLGLVGVGVAGLLGGAVVGVKVLSAFL